MTVNVAEAKRPVRVSAAIIYDRYLSKFMPIVILTLMVVIFSVASGGKLLEPKQVEAIINQTIIVATVATGATFIYASGSFDISIGYAMAVSAVLGTKAFLASGGENLLVLVGVCILCGVGFLMFNSVLSAVFKLPVFIVTIAMMSVLMALQTTLLGGNTLKASTAALKAFEKSNLKYLIFAAYFAICGIIFHKTRIGRSLKLIGGNRDCAEQTGISAKWMTLVGFLIAGVGVGLGAFLTTSRTGTLGANTGASLGMDVMIAVVLGGMPISGGARSNIFSATIGALMVVILNIGMTILRIDNDIIQLVRGVVFIVMVVIATKRGKLLPR